MSATWYNSGRRVRFLGIDGRGAILLIVMIYYMSWWTFGLAIVGIASLIMLERRGYSIPNAVRKMRVFLTGPSRLARGGRRRGRSDR